MRSRSGRGEAGRPRPATSPKVEGAHHDPHLDHHFCGRSTVNGSAEVTVTPVCVAGLLAEGERMPVYVHVIDHPDARVLATLA